MQWADKTRGKEPVVVFIHGWGMNATCMKPFQDTAKELGFATLNIDLPGHGYSKDEKGSFVEAVKSLKKLIGKRKCILVGYSMGGFIAQEYAEKYSVDGLFLISTAASLPYKALSKKPLLLRNVLTSVFSLYSDKKTYDYFMYFVSTAMLLRKRPKARILVKSRAEFTKMKVKDDIAFFCECLKRTSLDVMYDYYIGVWKHNFKKSKKNSPALVVCGMDDPFTSLSANQTLAKKLSADCVALPKTMHMSIIQKRSRIKSLLKTWLEDNYISKT